MDVATLKEAGQLGALGFLGIGFLWLILKTIPAILKAHADAIAALVTNGRSDQELERIARKEDREAFVSALDRNTQSNQALSIKLEGFCKAR